MALCIPWRCSSQRTRVGAVRQDFDAGFMAAGAHERQEIIAGDVGRRRILERVAVDRLVFHQRGIDHDGDALIGIVDQAKRP